MELTLSGCSITHIPKDGKKKKKHELKIVHQGADALVLAVQSKEQAEEWLKVTTTSPTVLPFLQKKNRLSRDAAQQNSPQIVELKSTFFILESIAGKTVCTHGPLVWSFQPYHLCAALQFCFQSPRAKWALSYICLYYSQLNRSDFTARTF